MKCASRHSFKNTWPVRSYSAPRDGGQESASIDDFSLQRGDSVVIAHGSLDPIFEFDAGRREDVGKFGGHIRVFKRSIKVPQHLESERRREVERAGLGVLIGLLHYPAELIKSVLVVVVCLDLHL